jgi:hypothetical protein
MKHTITIEPSFRYASGLLSWFATDKVVVVQSDKFKLGLRIKNTGSKPITPFTIKDIKIRSTDGSSMIHDFDKEYQVDALNPDEDKTYWISSFGTDMYGLANISVTITPNNSDVIEAHQISRFNSEEIGHSINSWEDFFYIKSSHEHVQENTNFLLITFTAIMTIVALIPVVFGYYKQAHVSQIVNYCAENVEGGIVRNKETGREISCDEYLNLKSEY